MENEIVCRKFNGGMKHQEEQEEKEQKGFKADYLRIKEINICTVIIWSSFVIAKDR
jgi:hypothetical protein